MTAGVSGCCESTPGLMPVTRGTARAGAGIEDCRRISACAGTFQTAYELGIEGAGGGGDGGGGGVFCECLYSIFPF